MSALSGGSTGQTASAIKMENGNNNNNAVSKAANNNNSGLQQKRSGSKNSSSSSGLPSINDLLWSDEVVSGDDVMAQGLGGIMVRYERKFVFVTISKWSNMKHIYCNLTQPSIAHKIEHSSYYILNILFTLSFVSLYCKFFHSIYILSNVRRFWPVILAITESGLL